MQPLRSSTSDVRQRKAGDRSMRGGGAIVSLAVIVAAPLFAAGFLAAATRLGRSRRRLGGLLNRAPSSARTSIRDLCAAVVGNGKEAVAKILGPPRAAANYSPATPPMIALSDFLLADTWYYALPRAVRGAMVIQFRDGIARDATIVQINARRIR